MVTAPGKSDEWANGQTYPVTWVKGLLDGVNYLDLELTRMSVDGLILVARDGPSPTSVTSAFRLIFFSLSFQYLQQAVASTLR